MNHLPAAAQWARPTQRLTDGPSRHRQPEAATAADRAENGFRILHSAQRPASPNVVVPGQRVTYSWSNGAWQYPQRYAYIYDAAARVTQESYGDSASNVLSARYRNTYNAQGLLAQELYERYNTQTAAWESDSRYTYTYDAYGNETDYLSQRWQNGSWTTQSGYRTAYTYNAAGDVTQLTARRYNATTGLYQFDDRETYTYTNGQLSEEVDENWDGTGWENNRKTLDIVWANWPARQVASYRIQSWDGTAFVNESRGSITYGANGGSVETTEEPTGPGGAWQPADRYTNPVDSYGNDLGYQSETWTAPNTWTITDASRYLLAYGAGGALLRSVEQRYDPATGQFPNTYRENYASFQTIVTGLAADAADAALATLSPNPTAGPLTLRLSDGTATGPGTVRDALGRVVLTFATGSTSVILLDLHAQPAGIYSVTVPTRTGALTRRVVRE